MEKDERLVMMSLVVMVLIVGIVAIVIGARPSSGGAAVLDSDLTGAAIKAGCIDSDGGIAIFKAGTTTQGSIEREDVCEEETLTEYYCTGKGIVKKTTFCADGCVDGRCIRLADSCDDTDGGNVPVAAGVASGYAGEEWYEIPDRCAGQETLVEQQCVGGQRVETSSHCGRGCVDGRCLYYADSCSDSDGGNAPDAVGAVAGYRTDAVYNMKDRCLDAFTLTEQYCSGSERMDVMVECKGGCALGRCLAP